MGYVSNFFSDLSKAQVAEILVRDKFQSLTNDWIFQWVGADKECRDLGDVLATDKQSGFSWYIEVKLDSRIADTGNVLCEEEVLYYETGRRKRGNMYNHSDYYCVVSKEASRIYIFDFKQLQKVYRKGRYTILGHAEQESKCFLVPLDLLKEKNVYIGEVAL